MRAKVVSDKVRHRAVRATALIAFVGLTLGCTIVAPRLVHVVRKPECSSVASANTVGCCKALWHIGCPDSERQFRCLCQFCSDAC